MHRAGGMGTLFLGATNPVCPLGKGRASGLRPPPPPPTPLQDTARQGPAEGQGLKRVVRDRGRPAPRQLPEFRGGRDGLGLVSPLVRKILSSEAKGFTRKEKGTHPFTAASALCWAFPRH